MANELRGRQIAFLATDGVEQVELTDPWAAVERAGGTPVLVSTSESTILGLHHMDAGDHFEVDQVVAEADAEDFAGLVLPGGVANPDALRTDRAAVAFVKAFADAGKPIAAICHGPWTLVEAGAVDGRKLTSWPSLQTDLRNAGAAWVDEELVVDGNLITGRNPDDLPAFCAAIVEHFQL